MTAVVHGTVRWRGMIALVAVLLLATGIGQTSLGHAILGRAGLFQPPASYTSLAFQDPQPVPGTLKAASPVAVSFVIHNTGGASRAYRWSVNVIRAGQARLVAAGTVTVAAGHGIGITQQAHVPCSAAGPVDVVVSLAHPAESIDAWTACPSPQN